LILLFRSRHAHCIGPVGGQSLEEEALTLAVVAHIRHRYSNYDELLMSVYERSEARAEIHDEVDRVLDRWHNPRGT